MAADGSTAAAWRASSLWVSYYDGNDFQSGLLKTVQCRCFASRVNSMLPWLLHGRLSWYHLVTCARIPSRTRFDMARFPTTTGSSRFLAGSDTIRGASPHEGLATGRRILAAPIT